VFEFLCVLERDEVCLSGLDVECVCEMLSVQKFLCVRVRKEFVCSLSIKESYREKRDRDRDR